MRSALTAVVTLGLAGILATEASAQAINGRTTGLTSPQTTVTFDEYSLADNTPADGVWASAGVNFGGGAYWGPAGYGGSSFSTGAVYSFYPCCTATVSMLFSSVMSDVAFNVVTNQGTSIFEAWLAGSLVGSFSGATDNSGGSLWYGFENSAFDEIRVTAGGGNSAVGIDNLQMSAVPEPGSMLLLGTGLAALGRAYRRRNKKVAQA